MQPSDSHVSSAAYLARHDVDQGRYSRRQDFQIVEVLHLSFKQLKQCNASALSAATSEVSNICEGIGFLLLQPDGQKSATIVLDALLDLCETTSNAPDKIVVFSSIVSLLIDLIMSKPLAADLCEHYRELLERIGYHSHGLAQLVLAQCASALQCLPCGLLGNDNSSIPSIHQSFVRASYHLLACMESTIDHHAATAEVADHTWLTNLQEFAFAEYPHSCQMILSYTLRILCKAGSTNRALEGVLEHC